jgi:hypothetical protein
MKVQQIRFKGQDYILVDGAIATVAAFQVGECSYAHLYEDGTIKRFGEIVGHRKDIEYVGEVDVDVPDISEALFNTISHPSWFGPVNIEFRRDQ